MQSKPFSSENSIDVNAKSEMDICTELNKIIYAESRLTGVPNSANPFDWPVAPY